MDVSKLLIILASITTTCQGVMPFKTQCLYWHNYYRRIHQVGPVVWSEQLQSEAEDWAKHLADNNIFQHSKKNPGNLYMTGGRPKEYCSAAIRAFYAEEKFYDYDKPGYRYKAGHFTQLVWKHTKRIGAAWAIRRDNKLVVVIKYNPGGNFARYFNTNVFPPVTPTARIELTTLPTSKKPVVKAAAGKAAVRLTLIIGSLILGVLI